jgi:hypothetical protein
MQIAIIVFYIKLKSTLLLHTTHNIECLVTMPNLIPAVEPHMDIFAKISKSFPHQPMNTHGHCLDWLFVRISLTEPLKVEHKWVQPGQNWAQPYSKKAPTDSTSYDSTSILSHPFQTNPRDQSPPRRVGARNLSLLFLFLSSFLSFSSFSSMEANLSNST